MYRLPQRVQLRRAGPRAPAPARFASGSRRATRFGFQRQERLYLSLLERAFEHLFSGEVGDPPAGRPALQRRLEAILLAELGGAGPEEPEDS